VNIEFPKDIAHMGKHCGASNINCLRNLFVGEAFGDKTHNFFFAESQFVKAW